MAVLAVSFPQNVSWHHFKYYFWTTGSSEGHMKYNEGIDLHLDKPKK
jgi:hypothetical protein